MILRVLFVLLGAGAGVAQIRLLAGSVRGGRGAGTLLRFALVAAVLLGAALVGELPAAAAGWLAGYAITIPIAARRLR
jgi:hypothetical protein